MDSAKREAMIEWLENLGYNVEPSPKSKDSIVLGHSDVPAHTASLAMLEPIFNSVISAAMLNLRATASLGVNVLDYFNESDVKGSSLLDHLQSSN